MHADGPRKFRVWLLVIVACVVIAFLIGAGLVYALLSAQLLQLPGQSAPPPLAGLLPTATPLGTIALSPLQAAPGDRITVVGQGWQPGDTVFVRLGESAADTDPAPFAAAIASDSGDLAATFVFPFEEP